MIPNHNLPTKEINGYTVPILDRPYTRIVEAIDKEGRLEMAVVHECDTVHCIAGWPIHLCGKQGYELEAAIAANWRDDDSESPKDYDPLDPDSMMHGLAAGRMVMEASSLLEVPGLFPDDYMDIDDNFDSDEAEGSAINARALTKLRELAAQEQESCATV